MATDYPNSDLESVQWSCWHILTYPADAPEIPDECPVCVELAVRGMGYPGGEPGRRLR